MLYLWRKNVQYKLFSCVSNFDETEMQQIILDSMHVLYVLSLVYNLSLKAGYFFFL